MLIHPPLFIGDNMRKSDRQLVIENSEIYQYYFERLVNLALAQFEWHNLPRTCDRLYFEKSLLFSGKIVDGEVPAVTGGNVHFVQTEETTKRVLRYKSMELLSSRQAQNQLHCRLNATALHIQTQLKSSAQRLMWVIPLPLQSSTQRLMLGDSITKA